MFWPAIQKPFEDFHDANEDLKIFLCYCHRFRKTPNDAFNLRFYETEEEIRSKRYKLQFQVKVPKADKNNQPNSIEKLYWIIMNQN